jgi:hypothetical protein
MARFLTAGKWRELMSTAVSSSLTASYTRPFLP